LVRNDRLLVTTPVEHDAALPVHPVRQSPGETGLADAGLASHERELSGPINCSLPRPFQPFELVAPTSESFVVRCERRRG
jgi:hypothetical protein